MKIRNKKTTSRKKLAIAGALVILVAGGSVAVWELSNRDSDPASTERKPTINYGPATDTEKKEADANKDRIVKEQEQNNPSPETPSGKKAVTPTITSTTGSIKAYVSGIFEEGGTCTATFSKGDSKLSRTSVGFQNVSYTQCAPIDISDGFLSPGTWSLVVSYSSATAEGSSGAQSVEVN
ncbi:hypothetical protein EKI60_01805 [Candidatus Saccharibacteria bacterium]|nr:MAG: hypothetical protein EKI60_01805 [Candidatus Saccharibacteria bacterium]